MQIDLKSDHFVSWIRTLVRNKNSLRLITLAYRLAKCSQFMRGANVDEPLLAAQIFCEYGSRQSFATNIQALLLDYAYVIQLLVEDDLYFIFGKAVCDKISSVSSIDKIALSNANITPVKQRRYIDDFTEDEMLIKASIIMAKLRLLQLSKSKGWPIKVHSRYLPIFDAYVQVGNRVAAELKLWLLLKIKEIQSMGEDYNLTAGDLFSYFSIVNDRRLKIRSLLSRS